MVVVGPFEFIRVWGEFVFTLKMIDKRDLFALGVGIVMQFSAFKLLEGRSGSAAPSVPPT